MHPCKKMLYRTIQITLHLSQYFIPFKEPKLFLGENGVENLVHELEKRNIKKLFMVSDPTVSVQPFYEETKSLFRHKGLELSCFCETKSNPSIQQIEIAYQQYLAFQPDAIMAVGGGSSIDLAKGIGIRVTHPNKTLQSRRGILRVLRKQPLLIAMPTTAGTGSEATVSCVVKDDDTHEKYAINDPVLIPKLAVLDPKTCIGLPKQITATTGMDALTHAVEAYIGRSNTRKTRRMARLVIQGAKEHLLNAYENGGDTVSRMEMLLASYRAGVAFTRAYVGNIHALAHQLGGIYHIPHGLANAVIMPCVLEYYGKAAHKRLSELYLVINPSADEKDIEDNALAFIEWIKEMNRKMNIPKQFDLTVNTEDLKLMASRAYQEANPLYPVPVIFDSGDFIEIYSNVVREVV